MRVCVCAAQAGNRFSCTASRCQRLGTSDLRDAGEESESARASVGEAAREVGDVRNASEVSEVRGASDPST